MKLHKLASSYAENGILSLKQLRRKNVYLYRYLYTNKWRWESIEGVEVLDDLTYPTSPRQCLLYLRYYYAGKVNLTEMLEYKQVLYRRITPHKEYLESNGIVFYYNTKSVDFVLRDEVMALIDKGVTTSKFPKNTRSKIEYRARKHNMTFREYVSFLIDGGEILDSSGNSKCKREGLD